MSNTLRLMSLLTLIVLTFTVNAQKTLIGQITDIQKNTPLPYATVIANDSIATITDGGGFYTITLDTLEQFNSLIVSYVGYTSIIDSSFVFPSPDKDTAIANFQLIEENTILGTVVVTGTNYEKSIIDEPNTIEVIQPDFIQNNNVTGFDQLIERVPGIQIQDGQVSIRSGGFSQGTGSRVGLMIDGIPMLGGDNAGIQWNFVPIENIEQVEVIKGAASVLYGSAAMNGVINVRTAFPTSEPYTNITLYSGVSSAPKEKYRQWWDAPLETPRNHGVFVSHRQKFGKLDFVIGGNTHRSIGHIEGDYEERYRMNLKTRYRVTDNFNLTLEAYGMMYSQPAYLSWMDGDTNVLRPLSPLDEDEYNNLSVALTGVYYGDYQIKHTARVRQYSSNFFTSQGDRFPVAMTFAEYQLQKNFQERFILTVGSSYQNFYANSLNFGRDSVGFTPEFDAAITSVYTQGDFNAFNKKLNIIAGLRWESINAGVVEDYPAIPPILRLSSTYKINDKNVLRMTAGQGYRFPSLYERFARVITDRFSLAPLSDAILEFGVKANPDLLPEFGWSAELGYKRVLRSDDWSGYLDFSVFGMRYFDMIYLTLDYHKDLGRPFDLWDLVDDPEPFGFQYINIDNTLVAGFEVGSNFNGKIANMPFRLWAGYTYTYPGDLDYIAENNESYFQNAIKAFTMNDSTVFNSMLINRSTHLLKFDLELRYKPFTLGFSAFMEGFIHRIDPLIDGDSPWSEFITLLNDGNSILPGVVEYREANPNNNWSFDAKLAYRLSDNHQVFFIVSNMLNTTFAARAGKINPLRTFNVKYAITL